MDDRESATLPASAPDNAFVVPCPFDRIRMPFSRAKLVSYVVRVASRCIVQGRNSDAAVVDGPDLVVMYAP
jgi:hypothetical protein